MHAHDAENAESSACKIALGLAGLECCWDLPLVSPASKYSGRLQYILWSWERRLPFGANGSAYKHDIFQAPIVLVCCG